MNNTIYIIWDIKYCPSKVYEVKLGDLTSDECYLDKLEGLFIFTGE